MALLAQGLPSAEGGVAIQPPADLPVLAVAVDVNRDTLLRPGREEGATAFRPRVHGTEPGDAPPPRGVEGGVPSPESKDAPPATPSLPQRAGLLTGGLPAGLAALERALKTLTEPESLAGRRGSVLLYWLSVSCWLLATALAYVVIRRPRSRPATALAGPGLVAEDVP